MRLSCLLACHRGHLHNMVNFIFHKALDTHADSSQVQPRPSSEQGPPSLMALRVASDISLPATCMLSLYNIRASILMSRSQFCRLQANHSVELSTKLMRMCSPQLHRRTLHVEPGPCI